MDNLLGLIFVLIAVSSAISKNKKKAGAARKSVVSPVQRAETHHKAKLARGN